MIKSRGWTMLGGMLIALASCRSPVALEGLTISVAVSADEASVGESVTITTSIRNDALKAVTIAANKCGPAFRVTTEAGAKVPVGDLTACSLVAQSVTLAPGDVFQFLNVWDGRDSFGKQLVGVYRIIGDPFYGSTRPSAPVTLRWLE